MCVRACVRMCVCGVERESVWVWVCVWVGGVVRVCCVCGWVGARVGVSACVLTKKIGAHVHQKNWCTRTSNGTFMLKPTNYF